ncbi:MAG: tetratricopeptide repeat protein, partial [Dehalococcoidia bacterium]
LACSRAAQPAETLNRNGNQHYAAGDYGGALETYRRAEVLRPDLPAIDYNAGNSLNRQSDFAHAVEEERRAAGSTDPDVQDRAFYSIGNNYVRMNQLREAVDAYRSALRANPSDIDAKYNLEVIQRRLDQEQARRRELQQQQDQTGQQAQVQPGQGQAGQPAQSGQPGQPAQGGQPGQQGQPGQPAQSGQPGQAQAGQPSQQGQPGQGQQAQPGQGQPGQPDQSGQANPGQPGQAGQPSAGGVSNGTTGYTGSAAGQANALDSELRRALDQFDKSNNIADALQALDVIGKQERISQAARGAGSQPQQRDW